MQRAPHKLIAKDDRHIHRRRSQKKLRSAVRSGAPVALAAAGIALLVLGVFPWAKRQLQGHRTHQTRQIEANAALGRELALAMQADTPAESLQHFDALLQAHPGHPDVLAAKGVFHWQRGEKSEALAAYQAANQHQERAVFHLALAQLHREMDLPALTVRHARQAVALAPNLLDARQMLTDALLAQGQWQAAADQARKAILLFPEEAVGHVQLGHVFAARNQWKEALAAYREARRLSPSDVPAICGESQALRLAGRPKEAVTVLKDALDVMDDPALHHQLALSLLLTGEHPDEALEQAWLALRAAPGHPPYKDAVAKALLVLGHHDEALALARETLTAAPHRLEPRLTLVQALQAAGKTSEAIALAKKSLEQPFEVWAPGAGQARILLEQASEGHPP